MPGERYREACRAAGVAEVGVMGPWGGRADPFEEMLVAHGLGGCRVHGPGCRVPAGWDREHSDSQRPYTVDELAGRSWGPHPGAYDSHADYMQGWALWKALRRDAGQSPQELAVTQPLRDAVLRARLEAVVADAPEHVREAVRQGLVDGGLL